MTTSVSQWLWCGKGMHIHSTLLVHCPVEVLKHIHWQTYRSTNKSRFDRFVVATILDHQSELVSRGRLLIPVRFGVSRNTVNITVGILNNQGFVAIPFKNKRSDYDQTKYWAILTVQIQQNIVHIESNEVR